MLSRWQELIAFYLTGIWFLFHIYCFNIYIYMLQDCLAPHALISIPANHGLGQNRFYERLIESLSNVKVHFQLL